MARKTRLISTAFAVLFTASLVAQAKPNFAGKWTLVADPNAAGGFPPIGTEATVVQDAVAITITSTTQMGEDKVVYKLDGSESKNSLNFGGNAIDRISKVKWDGNKLVVSTSMDFGGNAVTLNSTFSLDPSGNLSIESTVPDFQGGGAAITTKWTYKKS